MHDLSETDEKIVAAVLKALEANAIDIRDVVLAASPDASQLYVNIACVSHAITRKITFNITSPLQNMQTMLQNAEELRLPEGEGYFDDEVYTPDPGMSLDTSGVASA